MVTPASTPPANERPGRDRHGDRDGDPDGDRDGDRLGRRDLLVLRLELEHRRRTASSTSPTPQRSTRSTR